MHGSDNFQVLEWITAFLACTGSGFVVLKSRLGFPTLFLGNSVLVAYALSTAHWGFALMGGVAGVLQPNLHYPQSSLTTRIRDPKIYQKA